MTKHLVKKQLAIAVTSAALGLGAVGAQAYEQGDIIFRAGVATVAPNDESDPIIVPTLPEDALKNGVAVDSATSISLIVAWMINDKWALELLAAAPFEHDLDVIDLGISAGSTKHLPPTLSLQWYPRGGMEGWQPYLGFGVNYTTFFDESVDPALSGVLGEILGATSADLELDDSFGLAAQAGVDIPLNEKWAVNVGIWYIDIGTSADLNVGFEDGSSASVGFDVDIDPWVYNIGFAYKF